jgi:hypothetical protein
MKGTSVLLLAAILSLCGCATNYPPPSNPQSITAAQVFSNKAETWTFQNGFGDITTVDVLPQSDGSTVWHYTKNADRAYWGLDCPQAELYFTLEKDSTGAWYNTTGHYIFPFGCPWSPPIDSVYTNTTTPGMPRPYLIIGDSGITLETTFTDFGQPNTRWATKTYVEQVDTPVYSGPALVSEQWESCIHEKWDFAPNLGMVRIESITGMGCASIDPKLTAVRIY